ncbi:hypothetical protein [Pedobacter jejuensis]|uniref:hypothetical protein n=1 Tax=Pedobacter jejuensis TaxID=1268550 RepID=UPI0011CDE255|nr:hypothetical protein [Pedobacter jejuensis]
MFVIEQLMCESGQFDYFWWKNLTPSSPLLEERGREAKLASRLKTLYPKSLSSRRGTAYKNKYHHL